MSIFVIYPWVCAIVCLIKLVVGLSRPLGWSVSLSREDSASMDQENEHHIVLSSAEYRYADTWN